MEHLEAGTCGHPSLDGLLVCASPLRAIAGQDLLNVGQSYDRWTGVRKNSL
jgi:hypothetical protein